MSVSRHFPCSLGKKGWKLIAFVKGRDVKSAMVAPEKFSSPLPTFLQDVEKRQLGPDGLGERVNVAYYSAHTAVGTPKSLSRPVRVLDESLPERNWLLTSVDTNNGNCCFNSVFYSLRIFFPPCWNKACIKRGSLINEGPGIGFEKRIFHPLLFFLLFTCRK